MYITIFPPNEPINDSRGITSEAFIEAPRIPYIPTVYTAGSLIECLALKESSNNPDIINWNDCGSPSYGLLQFKEKTYQFFCVEKYGLPDDIMNPDYQRECAEKMILEGKVNHWSTAKLCL